MKKGNSEAKQQPVRVTLSQKDSHILWVDLLQSRGLLSVDYQMSTQRSETDRITHNVHDMMTIQYHCTQYTVFFKKSSHL